MRVDGNKWTWEISAVMHLEDQSKMSDLEMYKFKEKCARYHVPMSVVLKGDRVLPLNEIKTLVFENSGEYEGLANMSELMADEQEFLNDMSERIHKEAAHALDRRYNR